MISKRFDFMIILCVLGTFVWPAFATDAVRIGGFWIDGVSVLEIDGNQLIYRTANGSELAQPLDKVEMVRLGAYPEHAQAVEAIEQQQYVKAVAPLQAVLGRVSQQWAKIYVGQQLITAASQAEQPMIALQAYLMLLRLDDSLSLRIEAPVKSVANASPKEKTQIARTVRATLAKAPVAAKDPLQRLLDAATVVSSPVTPPPAVELPPAESAVILPVGLRDPVSDHLRAGRFADAAQVAAEQLQQMGLLSQKLYLRGMAQLALADAGDDSSLYRDAGLSFMRVVIHFPRSRYIGPALLEAGYVHAKIGRSDIARRLYERSARYLDIEQEPDYYQRYRELVGTLAP